MRIRAKRQVIRELYEFIVLHLDPDPAPAEDYVLGRRVQRVAKRATRGIETPTDG